MRSRSPRHFVSGALHTRRERWVVRLTRPVLMSLRISNRWAGGCVSSLPELKHIAFGIVTVADRGAVELPLSLIHI